MGSRISRVVTVVLLGLMSASVQACGSGAAGSSPGGAGASGAAGTGSATGAAGLGGVDAGVPNVVPTPGCGRDPGQAAGMLVQGMIQTMGVKSPDCADTQCGAWAYPRYYWMSLPSNYDNTKAYPLVLEGPGCGALGNDLLLNPALSDAAIRVGLTPSADAQAFHPVSPGLGCFDDLEGDDSVDWVFYENLYDKLAAEVCFDRNRVFAAGTRSGARMANELGCKYAGDALRPVRGVMTHGPGLPVDTKYQPTCTTKPMAGMWVDQINNPDFVFAETMLAVTRVMGVNGCTIGTSYETAEFEPFPLSFSSSTPDTTSCKMVKGCPGLFPLVICPLPIYNTRTDDQNVLVPGWMAFLKLFGP
jgi:hypothetical protein